MDGAHVKGVVGLGECAGPLVVLGGGVVEGRANDGAHGAGAVVKVVVAPCEHERDAGHLAPVHAEESRVREPLRETRVDHVPGVKDNVGILACERARDGELPGKAGAGVAEKGEPGASAGRKGAEGAGGDRDRRLAGRNGNQAVAMRLAGDKAGQDGRLRLGRREGDDLLRAVLGREHDARGNGVRKAP